MISKIDKDIERDLIKQITSYVNTSEIILFGSYVWGNPDGDSDIDLVVVLNEKGMSNSYNERLQRRLKVAKAIREIRKKVPVDLLVYTTDEWNYILDTGFSFHNKIKQQGLRLI